MVCPLQIRLLNHKTGELYASKLFSHFETGSYDYKNKCYSWIDCLLRCLEKGEDSPLIEFKFLKDTEQMNLPF